MDVYIFPPLLTKKVCLHAEWKHLWTSVNLQRIYDKAPMVFRRGPSPVCTHSVQSYYRYYKNRIKSIILYVFKR